MSRSFAYPPDGSYKPHGVNRRYVYRVVWSADVGLVRWTAVIEEAGERFVGRTKGIFNSDALEVEATENWVRAAVELAIERLVATESALARKRERRPPLRAG